MIQLRSIKQTRCWRARVGSSIALVGSSIALEGSSIALEGSSIALEGSSIALEGSSTVDYCLSPTSKPSSLFSCMQRDYMLKQCTHQMLRAMQHRYLMQNGILGECKTAFLVNAKRRKRQHCTHQMPRAMHRLCSTVHIRCYGLCSTVI